MDMKILVEGNGQRINMEDFLHDTEKLLKGIHMPNDDFEVDLEYTIDNNGNINITGAALIPPIRGFQDD